MTTVTTLTARPRRPLDVRELFAELAEPQHPSWHATRLIAMSPAPWRGRGGRHRRRVIPRPPLRVLADEAVSYAAVRVVGVATVAAALALAVGALLGWVDPS